MIHWLNVKKLCYSSSNRIVEYSFPLENWFCQWYSAHFITLFKELLQMIVWFVVLNQCTCMYLYNLFKECTSCTLPRVSSTIWCGIILGGLHKERESLGHFPKEKKELQESAKPLKHIYLITVPISKTMTSVNVYWIPMSYYIYFLRVSLISQVQV